MSPIALLISTLIFCFVYGAAYGAALNSKQEKLVFINRNSTFVAIGFAVLLFLLNKPFS
ncbi:MAG: Uncharacterised protein [Prochlorococcus marinus str. MIT 9215]|nr:MAG: Uncharacterised protein [Prochlorococcus marinus str. MIT 9215]